MIIVCHDLRDRLTTVRDQGLRGTCLAFATTAAHEVHKGDCGPLSPEYLYFFSRRGQPGDGCSFSEVSRALEQQGQPIEAECPYASCQPNPWLVSPSDNAFRRKAAALPAVMSEIVDLISSDVPVVLGIGVPAGFIRPNPPLVIADTGQALGLHAVLAVAHGRLDGKTIILVRNSWGAAWGDGGYAWLSESFLATHLREALLLQEELK